MHPFLIRAVWMVIAMVTTSAAAEPVVPAALDPWRGWVSQGQEFRACPLIAGRAGAGEQDFLCAWPGVLAVNADATGATLSQRWRVDVDSWIALAGDREHWPQQVTLNGQPAAVVDRGGPAIRVAAGSHEVRARIPWSERPQGLRVPKSLGLVALSIDGKPIAPVQRDGDELSLGRASVGTPEADSLQLQVYRRLSDGVPARLTTVIEVNVSGQAREELIGPVLPEGFAPLVLSGQWPARLDNDGRLRLRVQPGSDTVTLEARATAPLTEVTARLPAEPWPHQEIWSYAADSRLRVTSASGAIQVDPGQSQVPGDWQALPAFALDNGATLTIEERSRGLAADDRNRLTLDREMWLDFDGGGWFARDRVQGEMLQGWRLDAMAPYVLEHAESTASGGRTVNGAEQLLVTSGARAELSGVEWRTPAVGLSAGLRIAPAGPALPIAGWQDSFDRVNTVLHLPYGYRLLGASGADRANGSWISAWTLLDVFIAAIFVLLCSRLLGWKGGVVAGAYLVLGYQEAGSPLWSLLAVVALALIVRALPGGRLALGTEWLRRAALIALVLLALPFVATQLRYALHPQLENEAGYFRASDGSARQRSMGRTSAVNSPAPAPPPAPAQSPSEAAEADAARGAAGNAADGADTSLKLQTITVTGSNIRAVDIMDRYSQSAVVQTGAGEPDWHHGRIYELTWSGPVLPAQEVRLVIAPPWLVRSLRVVLVLLLAWLIVRVAQPVLRGWALPERMGAVRRATVLGACVAGAVMSGGPAHAQAFPPEHMLGELRNRLAESPKCAPTCASIAKADVSARGDEIRIILEAHALDRVALPLPINQRDVSLRAVSVDGVTQDGAASDGSSLWVALSRGVHRIELVFDAASDKLGFVFPIGPMRMHFSGDGWDAGGIADDRLLSDTLTLSRARTTKDALPSTGAQQFAPFVQLDRRINLGLDWTVSSTAERWAPKTGGFTVALPVLAGEHVTTPGMKVDDGRVMVAFGDNAEQAQWTSTLDKSATLTLNAPALADHAEVWRVLASPTWHVEFSGVPVIARLPTEEIDDYRVFEFRPLPGESLTLTITRPAAVQGATRAIDSVRLDQAVGQRASNFTLSLSLRASQGGEQAIRLPAGAELLGVTRNGEALNLRAQDATLSLPVVPGAQAFELRFRDNTPVGLTARTAPIALGLPAANIVLNLSLPEDRWLLAAGGPAVGPAVLYWSELAVMLLVAFALSRSRRSPLAVWQWILLGLGFSTFSWIALLVVVAWLFALDWRARSAPPASAQLFNVAQIGLAALTLIALFCVLASIQQGLLGSPDMHVAGNGSSAQSLGWFADRSSDALPTAWAISVPLWVYKLAMLAWALWLANALIGWLRRGFAAWTQGGYWRATPRPAPVEPATVEPMLDVPNSVPPPL